jgi:hypothetical protein
VYTIAIEALVYERMLSRAGAPPILDDYASVASRDPECSDMMRGLVKTRDKVLKLRDKVMASANASEFAAKNRPNIDTVLAATLVADTGLNALEVDGVSVPTMRADLYAALWAMCNPIASFDITEDSSAFIAEHMTQARLDSAGAQLKQAVETVQAWLSDGGM